MAAKDDFSNGLVLVINRSPISYEDEVPTTIDVEEGRTANLERVSRTLDVQFEEALALWLVTEKFSKNACLKTANEHLSRILRNATAIELDEARRLANVRTRREEYSNFAIHAASQCEFGAQEIVDILEQADAWPYRVLKHAKGIKEQGWWYAG